MSSIVLPINCGTSLDSFLDNTETYTVCIAMDTLEHLEKALLMYNFDLNLGFCVHSI